MLFSLALYLIRSPHPIEIPFLFHFLTREARKFCSSTRKDDFCHDRCNVLETREPTWHSTRLFEATRKRRRATPNSQPTGHANRVNIVPREWASRTTLAIPRPDNYFAASEWTARKVNDTCATCRNLRVNIISSPQSNLTRVRFSLLGDSGLLGSQKQWIFFPPSLLMNQPNMRSMHLHSSNSFRLATMATRSLVHRVVRGRWKPAGFRNEEVSHTYAHIHAHTHAHILAHARLHNVSRCCATGQYDSFRGWSINSSSTNSDLVFFACDRKEVKTNVPDVEMISPTDIRYIVLYAT